MTKEVFACLRVIDIKLLADVSWGRPYMYKLLNTNVHAVQSIIMYIVHACIGATDNVFWAASMSCAFGIF